MTKTISIYSMKGDVTGSIDLPDVFNTPYRPDLIQRAVVSIQSMIRQSYGTSPVAGLNTSAGYYGRRGRRYRQTINKEMSRLPREKPGGGGLGKVRRVPQSVGGRRAHPPKSEKIFAKNINNKEYLYAFKSAVAATLDTDLLKLRNHRIDGVIDSNLSFPLIIENDFENLTKTSDVVEALRSLNLGEELERCSFIKSKSGKSASRGRRYKKRSGVLVVVSNPDAPVRLCRNISGVDIFSVDELDVELLAPGTQAGRLTVWTKAALEYIGDFFGK